MDCKRCGHYASGGTDGAGLCDDCARKDANEKIAALTAERDRLEGEAEHHHAAYLEEARLHDALRAEVVRLEGELKVQTTANVKLANDVEEYRDRFNFEADANEILRTAFAAEREKVRLLEAALNIDREDVGRIMHESWTRTKRAQGFHHPNECPCLNRYESNGPCPRCHADLIQWDALPEKQKDINRHAFDDVLAELRRRAALKAVGKEEG